MELEYCSSYPEGNFGRNQLLGCSISLSPLYPSAQPQILSKQSSHDSGTPYRRQGQATQTKLITTNSELPPFCTLDETQYPLLRASHQQADKPHPPFYKHQISPVTLDESYHPFRMQFQTFLLVELMAKSNCCDTANRVVTFYDSKFQTELAVTTAGSISP
ncbi:hypothetical protein ACTFIW_013159 [Dictyostelium discoideum]